MLVNVDYDLCEGHGLCTLSAPGVFSFDSRGQLQVVERPDVQDRRVVEESVRMCPALAIQLVDANADAPGQ